MDSQEKAEEGHELNTKAQFNLLYHRPKSVVPGSCVRTAHPKRVETNLDPADTSVCATEVTV